MELKTKEAADTAGVSVRTLHHYDNIGLLTPGKVSGNGYRYYTETDIERLQEIMFLKELDFSLDEIRKILDSPARNRSDALKTQLKLLEEKRDRLNSIIGTINQTIKLTEKGIAMDNREKFGGFDYSQIDKHKKQYAAEAEERYGHTAAYMESRRKTSAYSKADWERITLAGKSIMAEIAGLMDRTPGAPEVQTAIEKWRQHITESYYDCTVEIFDGLGRIYISDERFRKNIDKTAPGLADFMSKAIALYCSG